MSDRPQPDPALLRRVLAPTPVGREELRDPQSGLSLPQRWLLGHIDGEQPLAALAALTGSPPAERLPRDAAKLVGLGLALDMGEPGPTASTFGPTTMYGEITLSLPLDERPAAAEGAPGRRRMMPAALAAAAVVAVGAGAAVLLGGSRSPAALPAAQAASAPLVAASAPSVPAMAAVDAVPNPELSASAVLEALTVVPRPAASAPLPAAAPSPPPTPVREAARPVVAEAPRPTPDPAPTAAPAVAPPPAPTPSVAPAPAPAPAPQASPAPAPAPATAAVATPATAVPQPAPTSAAVQAATAAPAPLRPLATVEPAFPREGLGIGSRAVLLQARLTIAPNGSVTQVTFPQTSASTRPFERAARAALLQWRFPEGSGERSYAQQLRFSED